jgi:hypothetical protein
MKWKRFFGGEQQPEPPVPERESPLSEEQLDLVVGGLARPRPWPGTAGPPDAKAQSPAEAAPHHEGRPR